MRIAREIRGLGEINWRAAERIDNGQQCRHGEQQRFEELAKVGQHRLDKAAEQ